MSASQRFERVDLGGRIARVDLEETPLQWDVWDVICDVRSPSEFDEVRTCIRAVFTFTFVVVVVVVVVLDIAPILTMSAKLSPCTTHLHRCIVDNC